jgi:hypothetical protein
VHHRRAHGGSEEETVRLERFFQILEEKKKPNALHELHIILGKGEVKRYVKSKPTAVPPDLLLFERAINFGPLFNIFLRDLPDEHKMTDMKVFGSHISWNLYFSYSSP